MRSVEGASTIDKPVLQMQLLLTTVAEMTNVQYLPEQSPKITAGTPIVSDGTTVVPAEIY